MRTFLFTKRNAKEILRDPVNLFFGLGFPLVLLGLFSIINASVPEGTGPAMFEIQNLAPGLAMFGSAFMSLFAGMLLAKDRTSSFLTRLYASPMRPVDFILGYTLPILVMTAAQAAVTLLCSLIAGLPFSANLLLAVLTTVVTSLLFIGLGLLCGSCLNEKAVGGVCGGLLVNVAGWFSGIFIPLDTIGGALQTVSHILPFYHAVEAGKSALSGDFTGLLPHLGIALAYAVAIYAAAIVVFRFKMRGDK